DGVRYYASHRGTVAGRPVLLARTGYTGEDGFELFTAAADAEAVWTALATAGSGDGLVPAGLAARDTLRLAAGMALYGNRLRAEPGGDAVRRRCGAGGRVRQAWCLRGARGAGRAGAGPAAPGAGRPHRRLAPGSPAWVLGDLGRRILRNDHQRRTLTNPGRAH